MTLYYHHNSRYLTFKPMITLTSLLLILITLCIIQLWCMWHYHNPFQFYPMDQSCDILSMHRCLSFDTSMRQMGRKFDDKGVSQIDLTTRGHPYIIQYIRHIFFLFYRYLNQRMISYDEAFHVEPLMSPDNGLGLKWPVGTILSVSETNSISHDGNYTCAPSTGVISDSVLVHIIDDGKIPPAAVYGDSSKAAGLKINTTHYFPGVLLYVMSQLLSTLLSSNAEIWETFVGMSCCTWLPRLTI